MIFCLEFILLWLVHFWPYSFSIIFLLSLSFFVCGFWYFFYQSTTGLYFIWAFVHSLLVFIINILTLKKNIVSNTTTYLPFSCLFRIVPLLFFNEVAWPYLLNLTPLGCIWQSFWMAVVEIYEGFYFIFFSFFSLHLTRDL